MIKIVFPKLNFGRNFPKGPNQLSCRLAEKVVISHLGKKVEGNIARKLLKYNFQLVLNGLVQDGVWLILHDIQCLGVKDLRVLLGYGNIMIKRMGVKVIGPTADHPTFLINDLKLGKIIITL